MTLSRASSMTMNKVEAIIALFSSLLLCFLLYGNTLENWWWADDSIILMHAIKHPALSYFYVPSSWQDLVIFHLTPWLSLTFDLDYALFGFNPKGFYAHHLLVIGLCSWLLYVCARFWANRWQSAAGSVLFLVGSPIAVTAHQLMSRHYTEGLLFFLIALWAYLRGIHSGNSRWGWLIGLSFAIAASAKEVYLPLGLLPFFIPIGVWRNRLHIGWPILLVIALYVPWRWYMLGVLLGGYTSPEQLTESHLSLYWQQFSSIPYLLFQWPIIGMVLICLFVSWALFFQSINQRRKTILLLATVSIFILAPLFPLMGSGMLAQGGDRFFVALWSIGSIGLATICAVVNVNIKSTQRMMANMLIGLFCFTLIVGTFFKSKETLEIIKPTINEFTQNGKAILKGNSNDIFFVSPSVVNWYIHGIIEMKHKIYPDSSPSIFISDEWELASIDLHNKRVFRYDETTSTMMDISIQVPSLLEKWRHKLRHTVMGVNITYNSKNKLIRWQLYPNMLGRFSLTSRLGLSPIFAPQGSMRVNKPPINNCFRFRYDYSEDSISYTPFFYVEKEHDFNILWKGMSGDYVIGDHNSCKESIKY